MKLSEVERYISSLVFPELYTEKQLIKILSKETKTSIEDYITQKRKDLFLKFPEKYHFSKRDKTMLKATIDSYTNLLTHNIRTVQEFFSWNSPTYLCQYHVNKSLNLPISSCPTCPYTIVNGKPCTMDSYKYYLQHPTKENLKKAIKILSNLLTTINQTSKES